jgi:hypothetical protein
MTAADPQQDCTQLDGGELGRVAFHWTGDRYQHLWIFGQEETQLLESIESDHSVPWPDSPPLQQVYRQSFGDGRDVMFGIGMAGRGHWSVSFTLVPDLRSWIVEMACCSPIPPELLASSYRLQSDQWQIEYGQDEVIQACFHSSLGLSLEPISALTQMNVDGDRVRFIPANLRKDQSGGAKGSTTIQWGYRLRIR